MYVRTPVMTSAMGGQPGTLMIGLPVMSFLMGFAPVGLGLAACTQPLEAHEPHAMIVLASAAVSSRIWRNDVATYRAVNAAVVGGRIAFHGQDVLAFVLLHDVAPDLFHLESCGGLQRVVVVQRDHVQDNVLCDRVSGANERFAAAGALQAVQPENGDARLGLHSFHNLGDQGGAQSHGCGGLCTEFQERATVDSMLAENVVGS